MAGRRTARTHCSRRADRVHQPQLPPRRGRRLVQNGPQRVWVSLDYTPLVYRLEPTLPVQFAAHTGTTAQTIRRIWSTSSAHSWSSPTSGQVWWTTAICQRHSSCSAARQAARSRRHSPRHTRTLKFGPEEIVVESLASSSIESTLSFHRACRRPFQQIADPAFILSPRIALTFRRFHPHTFRRESMSMRTLTLADLFQHPAAYIAQPRILHQQSTISFTSTASIELSNDQIPLHRETERRGQPVRQFAISAGRRAFPGSRARPWLQRDWADRTRLGGGTAYLGLRDIPARQLCRPQCGRGLYQPLGTGSTATRSRRFRCAARPGREPVHRREKNRADGILAWRHCRPERRHDLGIPDFRAEKRAIVSCFHRALPILQRFVPRAGADFRAVTHPHRRTGRLDARRAVRTNDQSSRQAWPETPGLLSIPAHITASMPSMPDASCSRRQSTRQLVHSTSRASSDRFHFATRWHAAPGKGQRWKRTPPPPAASNNVRMEIEELLD